MSDLQRVGGQASPRLMPHSKECVLRPGLILHYGVENHSEDCAREAVVDDHVRIVLVLEGAVDLRYGSSALRLAVPAGRPGQDGCNAAMVTMQEPVRLQRVVRQGDRARRISIGMTRDWMQETLAGAVQAGASLDFRHLETSFWTVSPRARMLAEQMLNPPALLPWLANLYQESRTLELVAEALSAHAAGATRAGAPLRDGPSLSPQAYRRMCELKTWLQQHTADALNLEQIAGQMHTTPSTLQRHFRLAHGMSVFDFLQRERLQQARQALERNGVSVEQATVLAGYANATSFATAFRRQFGLSPRQVRLRS